MGLSTSTSVVIITAALLPIYVAVYAITEISLIEVSSATSREIALANRALGHYLAHDMERLDRELQHAIARLSPEEASTCPHQALEHFAGVRHVRSAGLLAEGGSWCGTPTFPRLSQGDKARFHRDAGIEDAYLVVAPVEGSTRVFLTRAVGSDGGFVFILAEVEMAAILDEARRSLLPDGMQVDFADGEHGTEGRLGSENVADAPASAENVAGAFIRSRLELNSLGGGTAIATTGSDSASFTVSMVDRDPLSAILKRTAICFGVVSGSAVVMIGISTYSFGGRGIRSLRATSRLECGSREGLATNVARAGPTVEHGIGRSHHQVDRSREEPAGSEEGTAPARESGVLLVNRASRIISASPLALRMIRPTAAIIGADPEHFIPGLKPRGPPGMANAVSDVLAGERAMVRERTALRSPDGSEREVVLTVTPVVREGEIIGAALSLDPRAGGEVGGPVG